MSIFQQMRRTFDKTRYKLMSTQRLIDEVRAVSGDGLVHPLLEALKERLAHQDGSLRAVDWSTASMNGALLSNCDLKQAQLSAAALRGAYLGYSDLRSACFTKADLREANLRAACLLDAVFDRADLRGANLARADMRGASLVASDMTNANLWGADLGGVNLQDATMTNCVLLNVAVNECTTLPDGKAVGERVDWTAFTGKA